MRIAIEFEGDRLSFPLEYNQSIQGFIYHNIDETLASFLHNKGFVSKGRSFKPFTFSRLLGKYRISKDRIDFEERVKFWIASPVDNLIESFASNLARKPEVFLGDERFYVASIEVKQKPSCDDAEIFMLSPVTAYSTLLKPDGGKKTYYYNPKEEDFGRLINENMKKKYTAFYRKNANNLAMDITPVKVRASDEKIVRYKGFIIKGWMGRYRIKGNEELVSLAYDTGLGAKNSQGFGMFEISRARL
ncbi:MAG: CRISPR-associated endoribonuclease Cas6 [bacterium (Candidatus Stahlbacteria) CG08_land_8_20_14_0_20_40_26]|nr:MAG: CRISPR-associated endoribonuclease Cas6 [bacterium (Candidatus Stahlbacteria) CG23_combo_of_CG06-09_8_20_14_all_40_9]PIS23942.1 MAG: CRISPR-associated endoribonuclease Cas6 [bacterium (Candidatus Stahlbacteria) CG08_land_8_20_14_0_20_40_26]